MRLIVLWTAKAMNCRLAKNHRGVCRENKVCPVLVCLTIVMLASCAGIPTSNQRMDLTGVVVAKPLDTGHARQFALDLAAAVAKDNSIAYDAPSKVIDSSAEVPIVGIASVTSYSVGDADDFEKLLSSNAASTMDSRADLNEEISLSTANSDLSVEEIVVTVQSIHSEQVGANSLVTVDLYVGRNLNSGVLWEEVVPYVSTVDESGRIVDLVVQDDSWALALKSPPEPVTTGIDMDVLVGRVPERSVQESPSTVPASLSAPVALSTSSALSIMQRSLVVTYANTWWNSNNPAFTIVPNDCTNFASQAMNAGGWTMVTGLYTDDRYWWHTGNPLIPKSYAWADAQDFYDFAVLRSGRATRWASVDDLRAGDVLQYDITTSGMNHTMIVTSKVGSEPYLTYHTSNKHNKPFSAVYTAVAAQDSTPVWFALKV